MKKAKSKSVTREQSIPRPGEIAKQFLLTNIAKHPTDIVALAAKNFKISPVAVQKHLRKLVAEGRVVKEGHTRGTKWVLAPEHMWKRSFSVNAKLDEDQVFQSVVEPKLKSVLTPNVFDIAKFGFTEMVNNVVDHSNANKLEIEVSLIKEMITLKISDNGIGIFRKFQSAFNLENLRESILELTKGKVTTDPKRHTGEGIFFTSRAFDVFTVKANGLVFRKDNIQDDWFIESGEMSGVKGTEIVLEIRKNAPTILREIFDKYTDPETLRFERTEIVVKLAKNDVTDYISRSQAKRILTGLEKFDRVILDFRDVSTVGQGFVDEVFRVFANTNPKVKFEVIKANDDVLFMIRRGIPRT